MNGINLPTYDLQIDNQEVVSSVPLDIIIKDDYTERIIGRPNICLVLNLYDKQIEGISICFQPVSKEIIKKAILNSTEDKILLCSKFNINITADEWPTKSSLASEYLIDCCKQSNSKETEWQIEIGNIKIRYISISDVKLRGIIEREVVLFQQRVKDILEQKHDYKLQQSISCSALIKIVLRAIVNYNNSFRR